MLPRLLCVTGPTASGKTALSLRLAKRFGGEIVNADARQLYRDGGIGTGLPEGDSGWLGGEEVRFVEGIPHHLLGVSSPGQAWTVSAWCAAARAAVTGIWKRGHVPMIVGGTGLYVRSFCEGYVFAGPPDPALRARLSALPPEERFERLQTADPETARRIDRRNPYRVLRALERALAAEAPASRRPPPFATLKIARFWPLEALRERICARIDAQFQAGWIEEVDQLLRRGIPLASPLLQSIGFRAIAAGLVAGRPDSESLRVQVVRETWQYARRQLTWFRKEPGLRWVASEEEAETLLRDWLN